MSKLTIVFKKDWLDVQRTAGRRVVRELEKWIGGVSEWKLLNSSATSLSVEMKPVERASFVKALGRLLVESFKENSPWEHTTFEGNLEGLDVPIAVGNTSPDSDASQASSSSVSPSASPQKKEEKKSEMATLPQRSPAEVVEDICSTVPVKYSPELAAYVRETAVVIPMLQKLGVTSSFWRQHLLLAVEAGYGRSDFLVGLTRLYKAYGLVTGDRGEKSVREIIISKDEHDEDGRYNVSWEKALDIVQDMKRANEKNGLTRVVLYMDVSAWQNRLASPEVKRVLRRINLFSGSFLIVFRVPFLESHVLMDIADALNDIFNVRTLAVPPATIEKMTDYARVQFAERGFTFAADATTPFEQWILREKSDDSFFGYKTMDKMVHRAIYEKALSNCRAGIEDRTIGGEDLHAFVQVSSADEDPLEELGRLIGMSAVERRLMEVVSQIETQKELAARGQKVARPAIHMLFTGNPGTGKTTVARIAARLMRQKGILRKGHLVEVKGRDLCGRYVGETAPKTSAICRDAYGSVLFIDEAYSLYRGEADSAYDYGREALDTLVAEMENHRDDLCVIMAGYKDEMDLMLKGNSGLRSRIPYEIEFPNYSREDLEKIFFSMLDGTFEYEDGLRESVHDFFATLPDAMIAAKTFSNARFVRNLYERTWGKAAYRRSFEGGTLKILKSDLAGAVGDREFKQLQEKTERRTMGFGFQ